MAKLLIKERIFVRTNDFIAEWNKLVNFFYLIAIPILTGVLSKIKIEMWPVPVTFQTVGVLYAGLLLGPKRGALSQIIYILMGLLGFPLFARGGGLMYILSPTFGYLLGFVLASYLAGHARKFFFGKFNSKFIQGILIIIFANLAIYITGISWLILFTGLSLQKSIQVGFMPFIPGDIFKIMLVLLLYSGFGNKREL
ncbi:MAG: biotin transporter BioY [Candidatus Hydrothermia bacterium]